MCETYYKGARGRVARAEYAFPLRENRVTHGRVHFCFTLFKKMCSNAPLKLCVAGVKNQQIRSVGSQIKTRPCLCSAAAARRLLEVSLPLYGVCCVGRVCSVLLRAQHSNTYLVVVSLPTLCRVNIYTNAQRTSTMLAEPSLFSTFTRTLIFHRCSE